MSQRQCTWPDAFVCMPARVCQHSCTAASPHGSETCMLVSRAEGCGTALRFETKPERQARQAQQGLSLAGRAVLVTEPGASAKGPHCHEARKHGTAARRQRPRETPGTLSSAARLGPACAKHFGRMFGIAEFKSKRSLCIAWLLQPCVSCYVL